MQNSVSNRPEPFSNAVETTQTKNMHEQPLNTLDHLQGKCINNIKKNDEIQLLSSFRLLKTQEEPLGNGNSVVYHDIHLYSL